MVVVERCAGGGSEAFVQLHKLKDLHHGLLAETSTFLSLESMSAPLARSLSMRRRWPDFAAQWRGVLPFCGGRADGRWRAVVPGGVTVGALGGGSGKRRRANVV